MVYDWRESRAKVLAIVAVAACSLVLSHPRCVHAAGWPLEEPGRVLLGFGEQYKADGTNASRTHHGIDVGAEPGATVVAPLPGSVTFAGNVPSASGGTIRVVTIGTTEGSVTLLPLERVSVSRGDTLTQGEAVGKLATGGDGSSAEPHLHVGMKRRELYVDPLSVLVVPTRAPDRSESRDGGGQGSAESRASVHTQPATGARAAQPDTNANLTAGTSPQTRPVAGTRLVTQHQSVAAGARIAPGVSLAGGAASNTAAAGTHVQADPSGRISRSREHASHAEALQADVAPWFRGLVGGLGRLAAAATRAAAIGLFGVLAAIGTLWPLWRRRTWEGSGEVCVRAGGDDVAAVVGR